MIKDDPVSADSASVPAQHEAGGGDGTIPRVSIERLNKTFRTRRGPIPAIKDVSLDIRPGEITVLLGPSGCGKTTLLRCLAGLEQPDSGEIRVHGNTVYSSVRRIALPPEDRRLSMVFQSYALWPHMTVFDNVVYPLKNARVRSREARERTEAVLRTVGLEAYASAYPGQLSGGQQQRIALARAIVSNEGLILFDEPLSNLDAKVRERLRLELLNLHRSIGFSALYVTHDQTEAAALGDRVAVMNAGEIVQVGTPIDIYYAPNSRFVAQFVGSANELEGTVTARDGQHIRVATPVGPLLAGTSQQPEVSVGQRVIVLFRPEHCRPSLQDIASGGNTVRCQVQHSVFLGGHVEYLVRAGGTPLLLKTMEGELLPSGTPLTIQLDPARVRLFVAD